MTESEAKVIREHVKQKRGFKGFQECEVPQGTVLGLTLCVAFYDRVLRLRNWEDKGGDKPRAEYGSGGNNRMDGE